MPETQIDILWWIVVGIGGALMTTLFWLIFKTRNEASKCKTDCSSSLNAGLNSLREDTNAHKLYIAENYVTVKALGATETRITEHLRRIEDKIDGEIKR